MEMSAELHCPAVEKVLDRLMECPSLARRTPLPAMSPNDMRFDIEDLLLIETIYGHRTTQRDDDTAVWNRASPSPVLLEHETGEKRWTAVVGTWNIPMLRWLRDVALATGCRIRVSYDHERGDWPYEFADWQFDPSAPDGALESFGVDSHGGMAEPEWRREFIRCVDGTVECKQEGSIE
jgi:hypothetical protein